MTNLVALKRIEYVAKGKTVIVEPGESFVPPPARRQWLLDVGAAEKGDSQ